MPKFIVTSGQSFMPFSYEELVAPVMQTAELHRATQDVYDQIGMETAALQRYINAETDPRAQEIYQGYLNNLTTLQNNLWANGYGPQTRRDLAAARNGYASDVTRLQKAITDRQERSNEYHNIKLEHPDMVMGSDPGLESLDSYLDNDRFGRDYFTYSGNQFTQEVGTDAQARIKEMFEDPELKRLIPGYFSLKEREGVTSADVANARQAIIDKYNGSLDSYNSLDPVAKILADVLDSHIDSTGAQGRISSDEFGRLLEYGAAGLSHAIGETKYQHVDDWQSKLALQHRYAMEEDAYKAALSGAGGPDAGNYPIREGMPTEVTSPGYEKFSRDFAFKNGEPVSIELPGGGSKQYDNMVELAMDVYNPQVRRDFMNNMHVDVALDSKDIRSNNYNAFDVPAYDNDGNPIIMRLIADKANKDQAQQYGMGADDPIVFTYMNNGQVLVDEDFTREYNKRRKEYQQHVKSYEDLNKHISNKVGALSPENETRLRRDNGYGYNIPTEDLYHIEALRNFMGTREYSMLVNRSDEYDAVRGDYANNMIDIYKRELNNHGIKNSSSYAFEILGAGNQPTGKYTTDINDVFGVKNNGTNADGLGVIEVTPEDLIPAQGSTHPKIRIQGNGNNTMVRTTAMYLGPRAYQALESIQNNVADMMMPLVHPEVTYGWTQKQINDWQNRLIATLNYRDDIINANGDASYLNGPVITYNGRGYIATPHEIIQSEYLQSQLWNAVNDFVQETLDRALEIKTQYNMQSRSNSSTKQEPLRPRFR